MISAHAQTLKTPCSKKKSTIGCNLFWPSSPRGSSCRGNGKDILPAQCTCPRSALCPPGKRSPRDTVFVRMQRPCCRKFFGTPSSCSTLCPGNIYRSIARLRPSQRFSKKAIRMVRFSAVCVRRFANKWHLYCLRYVASERSCERWRYVQQKQLLKNKSLSWVDRKCYVDGFERNIKVSIQVLFN